MKRKNVIESKVGPKTFSYFFVLVSGILILCGFNSCQNEVKLSSGLKFYKTTKIATDNYILNSFDSIDQAIITINGNDIEIDFQNSILQSSKFDMTPDQFIGLAIRIEKGNNITLKNLTVRGFKIGIYAEDVTNLKLENIDGSYNYRPKLRSMREREDLGDWMSYHDNENGEWLQFGAAFYIKNCDSLTVKDCTVNQGQCALLMSSCNHGSVYNNNFSFNSALGIGMYRSSFNKIMHNKLDWNVRGYSHGIYRRGQDSAGILVYEQSSNNTFAYNSATHSGDGFFLWAGNTTMESGKGGSNDNVIYRNDFSHAPTNGVEVTFSSNKIIENLLNDCRYGLWGGYSFNTVIRGNQIMDNEFGIAIEHGKENTITSNYMGMDSIGIQLWERASQPADWGFAKNRNVESKNYTIRNNKMEVIIPYHINNTAQVEILNNEIIGSSSSIDGKSNTNVSLEASNQELTLLAEALSPSNLLTTNHAEIKVLKQGIDPFLLDDHPRGIKYILMNEWGPYNFEYPDIFLSQLDEEMMIFSLFGPEGNWKVVSSEGFSDINPMTGSFTSQIIAKRKGNASNYSLNLEFIGASFVNQFGKSHNRGVPYTFQFDKYIKKLDWQVIWCDYPETMDPIHEYEAFVALKDQNISAQQSVKDLAFRWWRGPKEGVHPDRFASFAETTSEFEEGRYKIHITSDDGLKFYIDGELKIDHWDIHVPTTDEIEVELNGRHHFEIHHFEGGGLATLDFRMERVE